CRGAEKVGRSDACAHDDRFDLGDGLVKTIKVGEVGSVSLNSGNVGGDGIHGLVEFLLAAARDEAIGALFDEKFCRSQANPFCAAGDDSDLAFEPFRHCLSPLLPSSELANSDASWSVTCVREPPGRGDRTDGSCGSAG